MRICHGDVYVEGRMIACASPLLTATRATNVPPTLAQLQLRGARQVALVLLLLPLMLLWQWLLLQTLQHQAAATPLSLLVLHPSPQRLLLVFAVLQLLPPSPQLLLLLLLLLCLPQQWCTQEFWPCCLGTQAPL
jgi:hypothetical protein